MAVALVELYPKSFTRIYWCEAPSGVNTQLPPLDLLYISSVLEKENIENDIITPDQINKKPYDWYVFHVSKQTIETDLPVIKQCSTMGKVIVFGCDVTVDFDFWSNLECVDYIVTGEPESKIVCLITDKHFHPFLINGLYPNYKKVDINQYHCSYIKAKPFCVSLSSRGCTHNCLFCSSHLMFGHLWRARQAYDVAYEMLHYQNMGIKTVWYYDDAFTLNRERVINICNYLKRFDVNVNWKTQTRADCLDKELISRMYESNCYELGIGVESGCQRILNVNNKRLDLKKVEQTFKDCNDVGMQTVAFFMLGMAYENQKTIDETIEFAIKINPTYVQFVLATPYVGTEFYKTAKKNGWLLHENCSCVDGYCLKLNDLDPDVLRDKLKEANRKFYFRPKYLFHQLRHPSIDKLKSVKRLIK